MGAAGYILFTDATEGDFHWLIFLRQHFEELYKHKRLFNDLGKSSCCFGYYFVLPNDSFLLQRFH
jgi:regulatory protein YycI of two-component signal transduction system YycFG